MHHSLYREPPSPYRVKQLHPSTLLCLWLVLASKAYDWHLPSLLSPTPWLVLGVIVIGLRFVPRSYAASRGAVAQRLCRTFAASFRHGVRNRVLSDSPTKSPQVPRIIRRAARFLRQRPLLAWPVLLLLVAVLCLIRLELPAETPVKPRATSELGPWPTPRPLARHQATHVLEGRTVFHELSAPNGYQVPRTPPRRLPLATSAPSAESEAAPASEPEVLLATLRSRPGTLTAVDRDRLEVYLRERLAADPTHLQTAADLWQLARLDLPVIGLPTLRGAAVVVTLVCLVLLAIRQVRRLRRWPQNIADKLRFPRSIVRDLAALVWGPRRIAPRH